MKKLDFKSTDIKEFLFKTPLRISSFITVIFCSVLFLFNFCNLCAYNKIQTPAELLPDQIEFLNASIEQNWPTNAINNVIVINNFFILFHTTQANLSLIFMQKVPSLLMFPLVISFLKKMLMKKFHLQA